MPREARLRALPGRPASHPCTHESLCKANATRGPGKGWAPLAPLCPQPTVLALDRLQPSFVAQCEPARGMRSCVNYLDVAPFNLRNAQGPHRAESLPGADRFKRLPHREQDGHRLPGAEETDYPQSREGIGCLLPHCFRRGSSGGWFGVRLIFLRNPGCEKQVAPGLRCNVPVRQIRGWQYAGTIGAPCLARDGRIGFQRDIGQQAQYRRRGIGYKAKIACEV
jgi:hypothetical protein